MSVITRGNFRDYSSVVSHRIVEEMALLAVYGALYLASVPIQLVEGHLGVDIRVEVLHLKHLNMMTAIRKTKMHVQSVQ